MEFASLLGVASAAGLNAYIPLLILGLLARYTSWVELPSGFMWMQSPLFLIVIAILLVVELFADKIPVIDHINDMISTVIRPLSGGIAGGSVAAAGLPLADKMSIFSSASEDTSTSGSSSVVLAIILGVLIALGVHLLKSGVRGGVNVSSAGFGAPVASTVGDISSVTLAVLALVFPFLVVILVILLAGALAYFYVKLRKLRSGRVRRKLFDESR